MENREGSGEVDVGRLAGLLAPMLDRVPPEQPHLDAAAWHALATRAVRERLGPLLYVALQRAGRTEVPAAVQTLLAQAHCRAAAAALYQQQELAAILRACAAAQIPCIVLKGSALAVTLYPDPALRPCGDIDLLFHAAHMPQVVELLRARGYESRIGPRPGARLPRAGKEYHFSRLGQRPAIVEPHWHITSNAYYARRIPVARWWEAATPALFGSVTGLMLPPPLQFLHLVTHYYLHYLGHHLLWSFDLALLLAQQGAAWNWDELADEARELGIIFFVQKALAMAAQQWGVAPPSAATAALAIQRSDYATRVAAWAAHTPGSPAWLLWQAAYTPAPWLRLQLLARLVLPSRTGVRHFWQCADRGRLVAGYCRRLAQLPRQLLDLSRQLWRLRTADPAETSG
jgi:hypothetical protein